MFRPLWVHGLVSAFSVNEEAEPRQCLFIQNAQACLRQCSGYSGCAKSESESECGPGGAQGALCAASASR